MCGNGACVAEEDIVVVDIYLPGRTPLIEEARLLKNRILLIMALKVVGQNTVALEVQVQVLVDALPFRLDTLMRSETG